MGRRVSQASVKESIDNLPTGLAIYEEDGSCRTTDGRFAVAARKIAN